jgi:hypothetical protein
MRVEFDRQHYAESAFRVVGPLYVSVKPLGLHREAYVSIRQTSSAFVSIRQHTPAYVSILVVGPLYGSVKPLGLQARQRQYLYHCTSKASKLSTHKNLLPIGVGNNAAQPEAQERLQPVRESERRERQLSIPLLQQRRPRDFPEHARRKVHALAEDVTALD